MKIYRDLNAIEEAKVIKMMTDLNITQQEVARRLGKSRPYIANMLRLLQLPKMLLKWFNKERYQVLMGVRY